MPVSGNGNFFANAIWDFNDDLTLSLQEITTRYGELFMDIDFLNFQSWSGFSGTGEGASQQPSLDQLRSWLASGQSDPRIVRDPDDIHQILLVCTGSSNASQVAVTACGIQGNSNFSCNDWGNLRLNLLATCIDEYTYQNNPIETVRHAEGLYNAATDAAPALPELKANLRAIWSMGNHTVAATVHYIDSVEYRTASEDANGNRTYVGGPVYGSSFGNPAVANSTYNVGPGITEAGIFAWTDMDIAYTYRGFEFRDGDMVFTIGSRKFFDASTRTHSFRGNRNRAGGQGKFFRENGVGRANDGSGTRRLDGGQFGAALTAVSFTLKIQSLNLNFPSNNA